MALSNRERLGKALDLLNAGLRPFLEREMKAVHKDKWKDVAKSSIQPNERIIHPDNTETWDTQLLLRIMWDNWRNVFDSILGQAGRNYVGELKEARKDWAHQQPISTDDTLRSLDNISRLLAAIAASEAAEVEKQKYELLRVRFEEQARQESRRATVAPIEGQPAGGLKPWRFVVTPHPDVQSGRFQQAEFAADLWQVYLDQGAEEYRKPKEFFKRTFLTEGLKQLLTGALMRLNGKGGDPVIELQTNFGGGKTHSMLALFHLFSGVAATELTGIEPLLQEAGVSQPPKVKRVVLVGNMIPPGKAQQKPDGTMVRTLWGELAWQLDGRKAYDILRESDETSTNPGDALRVLFNKYAPCLILIDEWVAYARGLHDKNDLVGGSFDTHFTFAQTLSEAAKAAEKTMLVVSIPASEQQKGRQTEISDVEVGGERGREALERLKNAIGRVESPWRPASTEEGFEIVRRRLFQPITDPNLFIARDAVVRAFANVYRDQPQEFPQHCKEADYERRLKDAYPIHPELFDRLYSDWSTLDRFQRTRGVLRLMATVIHKLWEKEDKNLLILPATVPIGEVQSELARYLDDNWHPVIEKDVDGQNSLPQQIDGENPNLGRFSACRRVARTLYLGSAPTLRAAKRGLEEREIKLGCVQPGESVATFGDSLRRLTDQATYLYVDGKRYWYSTQPSVTRLADDRATQITADQVADQIKDRIKEAAKSRGEFVKVHSHFPTVSGDIPDEREVSLVILDSAHPHVAKDQKSLAMQLAASILESRGSSPRNYKNMLVFLAADKTRLAELEQAVRKYLAWQSINDEHEALNLDPHQKKQAVSKLSDANNTVLSRIPETYSWLIVPTQSDPTAGSELQESRLQTSDPIVVRAFKKLVTDGGLIANYGSSLLRMELDRIPLWRGDHVSVKILADDFAKYIYLPRLKNTEVLLGSIKDGLNKTSWTTDTFAYADRWDEAKQRYLGLTAGANCNVALDSESVVVKPDIAEKQMVADLAKQSQSIVSPVPTVPNSTVEPSVATGSSNTIPSVTSIPVAPPSQPRRFYGSVELDATRLGRDAGKIAEEVVQHLVGLIGSKVGITLEIHAEIPDGAPDNVVRTVTENCRTLKFKDHGFEMS